MILALGSFVAAGAIHMRLGGAVAVPDSSLRPYAYGPEIEMTAHVLRAGRWKETSPGERRQTVDVQTEEILTSEGARVAARSGVRLTLYTVQPGSAAPNSTSPALSVLDYGQRIRLPVKLKLPRNFRNPGAFDYEGYLAANGIGALASGAAENVQSLPGFAGSRVQLLRTRIHSSIVAKVHRLWPRRPRSSMPC
jgi:competence protein ComEC